MPYGGWGTLGDLGMAAYQPRRQMMGPAQRRQPQQSQPWRPWDEGVGRLPGTYGGPMMPPGGPWMPHPGSADMPTPGGGGGIGGFPPGGMMPQPGPYGQGQQPGMLPSPWTWPQSKLMGR